MVYTGAMEPQSSPFNPVPTPAPVESPPTAPPANPPRSLRVLWIALIAVVVLAGAVYGWMKFYLPSPVALESASPSPSVDPTAGWKTYTNTQYGIELRYPTDFESGLWTGSGVLGGTGLLCIRQQGETHPRIMGMAIYPQGTFTIPFINKFQPTGPDAPTVVHVGDNQFYFYGPGGGGVAYADQYFFNANGRLVVIDFSEVDQQDRSPSASTQQLEQQILSTFKFTSPTAGWKMFSSKYFTLSFSTPPTMQVVDTQNEIAVAVTPFKMGPSGVGGDNAFMRLIRYTGNQTQAGTLAQLRGNNEAVVSSIVVGGQTFPRVDYTYPGITARFFTVFFEKSYLSVTVPSMNVDSTTDYIGLGRQILSTFKFTK